jgi:hypothetical protein
MDVVGRLIDLAERALGHWTSASVKNVYHNPNLL